jgi:hypothetical protein
MLRSMITPSFTRMFVGGLLATALVACDKQDAPAEVKSPTVTAKAGAAPATSAAKAPKVKEMPGKDPADTRYQLTVVPPTSIAVGEQGVTKITLLPKTPWHMNHEYPTTLKFDSPAGVTLVKGEQKKGDAVKFEDASAEFDVAFTATEPGEKTFAGEFRFAICQDEACSPMSENVEFRVAVK